MNSSILQIANDYCGSTVYKCFFLEIDKHKRKQFIFTTVRNEQMSNKNPLHFYTDGSMIFYNRNWSDLYRLSFRIKSHNLFHALTTRVPLTAVGYTHAHTLFSDGVLALKLKRKFGIPYSVAVRNTDVNLYMKYMPHTWAIGHEILAEADHIICISPAQQERLVSWDRHCTNKIVIIPNGVNSYWIENLDCMPHKHKKGTPWKLIYTGNFTANKNVPKLMNAVIQLNEKYHLFTTLDIVGGEGRDDRIIHRIAETHPNLFTLHGVIRDKDKLRTLYHNAHIFAMPSKHETFGLVYIEALSQGLPILYTRGQGVDGFFDERYGFSCNPYSQDSIADRLFQLIERYSSFEIDDEVIRSSFNWESIAKKYLDEIYTL